MTIVDVEVCSFAPVDLSSFKAELVLDKIKLLIVLILIYLLLVIVFASIDT